MTTAQIDKGAALWLAQQLKRLGITAYTLGSVAADADLRAYYRIQHAGGGLILMRFLAEPRRVRQVVQTTAFFAEAGIRIPELLAHDDRLGLVLQEDLGERLLWQEYHATKTQRGITAMPYYEKAVRIILDIQQLDGARFGSMDEEWLVAEMRIFTEWLLDAWLGKPSAREEQQLENYYHHLARSICAAPQCCVHRDFHSRNLCILADHALGVLDYQGMMQGHFCYDLMALVHDAYIDLPRAQTRKLFDLFCAAALTRFPIKDKNEVVQQFNLIGLQRSIKVCGQFVRLWLRDNKPQYQQWLPAVARTIDRLLTSPLPDKTMHGFFTDFWQQTVKKQLEAKRRKIC